MLHTFFFCSFYFTFFIKTTYNTRLLHILPHHLDVFVAVHRVIGPHHLPNGVHGQLRRPHVDRPDTRQGGEGGADRAPAAGVALHLSRPARERMDCDNNDTRERRRQGGGGGANWLPQWVLAVCFVSFVGSRA